MGASHGKFGSLIGVLLLDHEAVPAMLCHELATEALLREAILLGRVGPLSFDFFSVPERLHRPISFLTVVLHQHAVKFVKGDSLVDWVRVEDNIFTCRGWHREKD